ncbi:MAG: DUF177 domain-containing protein [Bacteroidales bacterium]
MSSFIEQYNIQFKGLKTSIHHFNFELTDRFFNHYENPDCPGGAIDIDMEMDKKNHLLAMSFIFHGRVRVTCDRCLEDFDMPVNFKSNLFVRFGEEGAEKDPDVIYVDQNEHHINLADYFIESVCVNLPVRKIHPIDDSGNETCNRDMIRKLNEHITDRDTITNPAMEKLKDLISKKN